MDAFAFLFTVWTFVLWMWLLILGIVSYEKTSGEQLVCGAILLLLVWIILFPAVAQLVFKIFSTINNIITDFIVKDSEKNSLIASLLAVTVGLLGMSILTLSLWLWQKSLFPPF